MLSGGERPQRNPAAGFKAQVRTLNQPSLFGKEILKGTISRLAGPPAARCGSDLRGCHQGGARVRAHPEPGRAHESWPMHAPSVTTGSWVTSNTKVIRSQWQFLVGRPLDIMRKGRALHRCDIHLSGAEERDLNSSGHILSLALRCAPKSETLSVCTRILLLNSSRTSN